MAKLIYNIQNGNFCLTESDRDRTLNNSRQSFDSTRRQCAFFIPKRNIDQEYKILFLFGIDDTNLKNCKQASDNSWERDILIISEDVNPYVMKLNWRCMVYFGNDIPVVKSKTVKTKTKHYQLWTGNTIYKEPKPETYFYVEVKEKDKLFFFHSSYYDFNNGERLLEFNEKEYCGIYYYNRENFDYIAKLDYTDERFNQKLTEKIEREKKEREEMQRRAKEIERRKHTDGFCDVCGEPADLVIDPYQHEINNIIVHRWLCRHCYEICLGEI